MVRIYLPTASVRVNNIISHILCMYVVSTYMVYVVILELVMCMHNYVKICMALTSHMAAGTWFLIIIQCL